MNNKNKKIIRKKRYKLKWHNIITILIIAICLSTLLYSLTNIILWHFDNKKTEEQIDEILANTEVIEIEPEIEIVESEENNDNEDEETTSNKNSAYWNYMNMNLIYVDFEELKSVNNSVKGWIQLNGTNINYPFVQAKDNKYYLTHSFDKSYNQAGWVFMDYRNNIKELDKNTILYAHGRVDSTMFGTLRTIFSSNWYKNKDNHVIKMSTETENSLWQVFSVYRIKTTSDYLKTKFANDSEYLTFLNMLKDRSKYTFDTTLDEKDKIITLSTCYNKSDKIVMHAKLIKTEKR